ncbi:hypothetical protein B0T10DRAFT_291204 [Thelonectria olida]|uniref:Homeobox domain-containing protein n=1 Tax=Thelonectria olida TaxID=1576542 RepID=A0A9P9AR08_9HYPO|nr:hypothetical protein B0T10DRAFT_291204 [Thelonectria olida]
MLVTRQCDTDHSHWPFSKYDPSRKPPSPPRMSNPYDAALPVPSEWQGQHQYPPTSGHVYHPQSTPSAPNSAETSANALGIHVKERTSSPQIHRLPSAVTNLPEARDGNSNLKIAGLVQDNPRGAVDAAGRPVGGTSLSPGLSNGRESRTSPNPTGLEKTPSAKSDEEDDFDEDDMLDGEGDHSQTAAERTAARRKMKRFRLTHQQTRFLMSEFAKQPHPDAAHRERLSREIPGLSPRQVQVWFQNRRAKIKRLNADDRDRMIKMRAVPDDFDNVQALHSQYGAVHGLGGAPMAPAAELGQQSYAQHMMRPLIVDVRRPPNEHASPTGLTPGFGALGFSPAGGISSPAMMSPISPASSDRYPYGSHYSAPMNGAARTSHPFGNQHGLESPLDASRQNPHPLQPSQLRDSISRARSESAQSPLRSSMAWKGDSIDYAGYRGANTSPGMDERNPPMYQQPGNMGGYDSASSYHNSTQPPPSASYPAIPPPQSGSRLRSSTTSLPLNVDPRDHHYRTAGSDTQTQSPLSQARSTPTSTSYSASSYTTSYPSAPLTAPMEYSVPRSSDPKTHLQEPQMSAPIAPPSDFSQALHGNMGSQDQGRNESYGHGMSGREGHKRKRSLTLPTGATRPLF